MVDDGVDADRRRGVAVERARPHGAGAARAAVDADERARPVNADRRRDDAAASVALLGVHGMIPEAKRKSRSE